ncbi:hypothetical protein F4780DRAFT_360211 [Xylariomycetidae sp. FL0641]|nr:hypothetical protein F4780DRAFT_360211 [Xylariomycetidae sp. FL0641]
MLGQIVLAGLVPAVIGKPIMMRNDTMANAMYRNASNSAAEGTMGTEALARAAMRDAAARRAQRLNTVTMMTSMSSMSASMSTMSSMSALPSEFMSALAMNQKDSLPGLGDDDEGDDEDFNDCGCGDACSKEEGVSAVLICVEACLQACPEHSDNDDDDEDDDEEEAEDELAGNEKRQQLPFDDPLLSSLLSIPPMMSTSVAPSMMPSGSVSVSVIFPSSLSVAPSVSILPFPTSKPPMMSSSSMMMSSKPPMMSDPIVSIPPISISTPMMSEPMASATPGMGMGMGMGMGSGATFSSCAQKCESHCQSADIAFDISQCQSSCEASCTSASQSGAGVSDNGVGVIGGREIINGDAGGAGDSDDLGMATAIGGILSGLNTKRGAEPGPQVVGAGETTYDSCMLACDQDCQGADIGFPVGQCDGGCAQQCAAYSAGGAGVVIGKKGLLPVGDNDNGMGAASSDPIVGDGMGAAGGLVGSGSVSYDACMQACDSDCQTADVGFPVSQCKGSCAASCTAVAAEGAGVVGKRQEEDEPTSTTTGGDDDDDEDSDDEDEDDDDDTCGCKDKCEDKEGIADIIICVEECLAECPDFPQESGKPSSGDDY